MQKHAHACNNSCQVLTPAFDGQVEDNPGTCYAPYLTKDTSAFKLRPGNNPQMLGQAPCRALGLPPRLAGWATERRTVHERVPPDWRAAPAAGLPGAAVGLQGPLEVPALPVHVDVAAVHIRP